MFEEFFLEPLQEKVFVENSFYDRTDVQIMCSTLKKDASSIGASLLPFERIFSLHEIQSKWLENVLHRIDGTNPLFNHQTNSKTCWQKDVRLS